MQVISTALGYVLPNLISRQATQHAATALYTFFGMRLLWIAWRSKPQASNQDEVEEVEAKLEASEQQPRTKLLRMLNRLCTPVFLEALILTFLAGILSSVSLLITQTADALILRAKLVHGANHMAVVLYLLEND